jgi:hypothetical protein
MTSDIMTMVVSKADVAAANDVLKYLGHGDGNFAVNADSHFVFCAPVKGNQKQRIIDAMDDANIAYKLNVYENDGNVKAKLQTTLTKEGLQNKIVVAEDVTK